MLQLITIQNSHEECLTPEDENPVRRQSVLVAICRRLDTINSRQDVTHSFLSGGFWSLCCTRFGASIAVVVGLSLSKKFPGATVSIS
jgi:hypothetical protein